MEYCVGKEQQEALPQEICCNPTHSSQVQLFLRIMRIFVEILDILKSSVQDGCIWHSY